MASVKGRIQQAGRYGRRLASFAQRQTARWRLMLGRKALHVTANGLTSQYDSIYASLLGADPVQLGSLNSLGNAVGAFVSIWAGWFIDYYSLKVVFLVGTALLVVSRLFYSLAPTWVWLYAGVIFYYLGQRVTCTSCTVTCATELSNDQRATGRGLCNTLSSIMSLIVPMIAAWLIAASGGITVSGLRPLYGIQLTIFLVIFVVLMRGLASQGRSEGERSSNRKPGLKSLLEVFEHGPDVVRMVLVMGLTELPWSIMKPFAPLYAREFKGADQFILGGIAMAMTIVPMLFSMPLGHLADRYGRKKLLFVMAPLAYLANLILVLAPETGLGSRVCLLGYGVLFGFNGITMMLASSMAAEMVPKQELGRWIGAISLVRGLISIPAPLIGGVIWEHVGPQYVFFAALGIDILFRVPLLASVRETLHS